MAANATFALKAGVWFRRGRLLMVSPDSRGTACPPSGRNSTYRPVQISGTGSELNVMGRWLEITNIIQAYYQDQVNQAVGRNRGFRQSPERETKAALITSRRLWKSVLSGLLNSAPRVQLYEIVGKPW